MKTFQKSPCGGLERCGLARRHGEQENKVIEFIAKTKNRIKKMSGKIDFLARKKLVHKKPFVAEIAHAMTLTSNLLFKPRGCDHGGLIGLKAESS